MLAAATEHPSYLVLDATGRRLYAVNEVEAHEGRATGLVSAFAVDRESGALSFLNRQPSEGASPCHLTIDPAGRHLLVANYHGGSIACLPIRGDGGLAPATSVVRHEGHGPRADRQEGPHAHSIHLDPAGRVAVAVDLGLDRLMLYDFDGTEGRFRPHTPPWAETAAGVGPRHLVFHPDGRFAFVDNELDSTVTAFAYAGGRFTAVDTQPTLPPGFTGANTPAEIACAPDGRFLYVSNRGHESIAVFAIDPATGRLHPEGHAGSGGRTPRHFTLSPGGAHLLVANQDSGNVVVFARDARTGALSPTGAATSLSRPVCVRFLSGA